MYCPELWSFVIIIIAESNAMLPTQQSHIGSVWKIWVLKYRGFLLGKPWHQPKASVFDSP